MGNAFFHSVIAFFNSFNLFFNSIGGQLSLGRWENYGPGGSKENAVRRAGSRQLYLFSLRICSISIGKHTRHSFGIFYLLAGFGLFRGGGGTGVDTWQMRGNEGQPERKGSWGL